MLRIVASAERALKPTIVTALPGASASLADAFDLCIYFWIFGSDLGVTRHRRTRRHRSINTSAVPA
jgi:hypothetical protein